MIEHKIERKTGRIVVITGARQTGKTTLVKNIQQDYQYISLEDPMLRESWKSLTADEWYMRYPRAILDEVQKVPSLIESVKAVYDKYDDARYILLGSSQILLLKQIRESLAGRASIYELYPLTLPEVRTTSWNDPVEPSLLVKTLNNQITNRDLQDSKPLLDPDWAKKQLAWDNYLDFGLMPVMCDSELDRDEKLDWLKDYTTTYLQRDIRDIARINDLEPFVKIQKHCGLLSSQTINYSQLASRASVSVNTAKRFLSYLELSYQTIILPPWSNNEQKRLVKSPKLHVLDPGILRTLTGHSGELNGHEFESAVVSEIYKQIATWRIKADCFHLRTSDGREVDLLIETPEGFYAFEIKQTTNIRKPDARHLLNLEEILNQPLRGGFILSNDRKVHKISENITALPVSWFLG